jgi:predicted regulator of Ras-like GTPase activity (Roadblock/LC7/MglB family)
MAYSLSTPAGEIVQELIDSLPSLIAVAVVDSRSGMALASHSNLTSLNPETAAAYNTEVVKQKQKAMNALKLHGAKIEDILITLSSQLHLIKLTDDGKKFIYLVVSSRDTNLASARELLCQSAVHLR